MILRLIVNIRRGRGDYGRWACNTLLKSVCIIERRQPSRKSARHPDQARLEGRSEGVRLEWR